VARRPSQMLLNSFDRRKFITLSAHLCLQHTERGTGHRAISSGTAETVQYATHWTSTEVNSRSHRPL